MSGYATNQELLGDCSFTPSRYLGKPHHWQEFAGPKFILHDGQRMNRTRPKAMSATPATRIAQPTVATTMASVCAML